MDWESTYGDITAVNSLSVYVRLEFSLLTEDKIWLIQKF